MLIFANVKVSHECEAAAEHSLTPPDCVCPAWARCNGVKVPCFMNSSKERKLDQGNCEVVRPRGKEAYVYRGAKRRHLNERSEYRAEGDMRSHNKM
jgi:hypothetical protein